MLNIRFLLEISFYSQRIMIFPKFQLPLQLIGICLNLCLDLEFHKRKDLYEFCVSGKLNGHTLCTPVEVSNCLRNFFYISPQ